ncbi:1111_t:CDS:2 [Ambispora gerdemannii]|uniref:1111_t:CDS:1 n=1 Tax=Ambispora gerdemannii TaxID=144530 RepID=A0A9N9EZB5_9GLOM|nr:1111_t:CDS:2 [Ambispora gerdemannii]
MKIFHHNTCQRYGSSKQRQLMDIHSNSIVVTQNPKAVMITSDVVARSIGGTDGSVRFFGRSKYREAMKQRITSARKIDQEEHKALAQDLDVDEDL